MQTESEINDYLVRYIPDQSMNNYVQKSRNKLTKLIRITVCTKFYKQEPRVNISQRALNKKKKTKKKK